MRKDTKNNRRVRIQLDSNHIFLILLLIIFLLVLISIVLMSSLRSEIDWFDIPSKAILIITILFWIIVTQKLRSDRVVYFFLVSGFFLFFFGILIDFLEEFYQVHESFKAFDNIFITFGMVVASIGIYFWVNHKTKQEIIITEINKQLNTEICERKLVEEELNEVHTIYQKSIENARGVPYRLNYPDRKYEYIGSGCEDLLGIPAKKMTAEVWKQICKQYIIIDKDVPQDLKKYAKGFLKKEYKRYRIDIKIQTPAGDIKWINDCSLPLVDETTGEVIASLGILQDITDRKRSENLLEKLLNEKEMLLKEVYHRVKNNFSLVSSLLNLQSHHVKDKIALETLNISRDRIQSMAMVHQQLYQSIDLESINLKNYIESLTNTLFNSYVSDDKNILLETHIENLPIGADLAIPCGLIATELITNAIKYAYVVNQEETGIIAVTLSQVKDKEILLVVQDNGRGMPDNFDIEKTESLGLKIVILLVKQIKGTIDIESRKGAKFTIKFNVK
jgi:two-component sensor histidine kinase/PAS domain-containing protein